MKDEEDEEWEEAGIDRKGGKGREKAKRSEGNGVNKGSHWNSDSIPAEFICPLPMRLMKRRWRRHSQTWAAAILDTLDPKQVPKTEATIAEQIQKERALDEKISEENLKRYKKSISPKTSNRRQHEGTRLLMKTMGVI